MKGNPWKATAVSENSEMSWLEIVTSTATTTRVMVASPQARRVRTSAPVSRTGGEHGPHSGPPAGRRVDAQGPADRFHPVPQVRQPGAGGQLGDDVARAVVLDHQHQRLACSLQ